MDYEELVALQNALYQLKELIADASVKAHEVFNDVHNEIREVANEA